MKTVTPNIIANIAETATPFRLMTTVILMIARLIKTV